ncbi:methoxymalonyl-ACP biosynthesis protein FkbH [Sphingomonas sp. PAMC 26617]|uniref:methoxymalonyl-ACP biosynthesis protein FkbH n=1 Tax=Sphingomonas sp. PAMC 26617 TaxID=1112216 RepID=UPI000287A9D3|nr:methoxymalonyl-ACP biosynthesis protein FkbH [Sphingomonas sp. PAMC 26617]
MLKLIIWDLDDTLWRGTLADGDDIAPFEQRIAMVRAFNARGVVSSICSKNDAVAARARLEALGWWDAFVFCRIAFDPKPASVAGIIADMQLRPCDVLFVDDNPQNLEAVRYHLPDIQLLDSLRPDADDVLRDLLAAQVDGTDRRPLYRSLEARKQDQRERPTLSHEDFLRSCDIRATASFCMENLDHVERIAELMQRSNQLNYTKSRRTVDALRAEIIDVLAHPSLAIFAWDRHGDYGLVGFVMLRQALGRFQAVHLVFSCRAMHMGLERAALDFLRKRSRDMYAPMTDVDLGAAGARISAGPVDWVAMERYADPAVRAHVATMSSTGPSPDTASIRIMFNCQSGGIAHFSARRDQIAFDSFPELFCMRAVWDDSFTQMPLPDYLVYGAGTDYVNKAWQDVRGSLGQGGTYDRFTAPADDMSVFLDHGVYEVCVLRLCTYVLEHGKQLLVVLPSEDLSDDQYQPGWGFSRERAVRFNALWRRMFAQYSCISTLDSGVAIAPAHMSDVSHYTPAGLQTLAEIIDSWRDQVTAPGVTSAGAGELRAA